MSIVNLFTGAWCPFCGTSSDLVIVWLNLLCLFFVVLYSLVWKLALLGSYHFIFVLQFLISFLGLGAGRCHDRACLRRTSLLSSSCSSDSMHGHLLKQGVQLNIHLPPCFTKKQGAQPDVALAHGHQTFWCWSDCALGSQHSLWLSAARCSYK